MGKSNKILWTHPSPYAIDKYALNPVLWTVTYGPDPRCNGTLNSYRLDHLTGTEGNSNYIENNSPYVLLIAPSGSVPDGVFIYSGLGNNYGSQKKNCTRYYAHETGG